MSARPAPVKVALAVALYRQGWTLAQIAADQKVGTTTVWRRLRAAREPLRKPNGRAA